MPKRTKRPHTEKFNEKSPPNTIRTIVMEAQGFQPTIRRIANSEYHVFPAVLLVEGVHHGVGTDPVYYPPATLEAVAPAWNNIPVTIGHPVDKQGRHIMVNHDGSIQQLWTVGHVMNAHYEGGKLKGEVWIDQNKVNQLAPGLIEFLQNGGQLEVSTGLLSLDDGQSGTWNEEEYTSSVLEIVPDHFALLPNSTGACSWEDGCGIRWNVGIVKDRQLVINSTNLQGIVDKVYALIDSMDEYDNQAQEYLKVNYVRAIYDDYFVYKQRVRLSDGTSEETFFKQLYSLDTNEDIVLSGDPTEVVEEVSYKIKSNSEGNQPVNSHTNTKEKNMAQKQNSGTECCEKRIDALIANEENGFVEADKEWLTSLNEELVEKLEAIRIKEIEVEKATVNEEPTTLEGWLKTVPAEICSVVNSGMMELDKKRASLIGRITANENNKFTEEQLKGMDMGMLESVVSLLPVEKQNSFELRTPADVVVNEGEEAYIPTTLSDKLTQK